MRTLTILLALLISSLTSVSQNHIDSLILDKINEYRLVNDLNTLEWDTSLYNVAKDQSYYIAYVIDDTAGITHYQTLEIDSFNNEPDFRKRFSKFGIGRGSDIGENITIELYSDSLSDLDLVNAAFNNWVESPGHNALLLDTVMTFGAVSHFVRETPVRYDINFDTGELYSHSYGRVVSFAFTVRD